MIGLKYIMFITETPLKEIAAELNVTPQFVASWNKGTRRINNKYKEELSKYFKVDKQYISKELTLEDKINIELQLNNKTFFNKETKDFSEMTSTINIMREKYRDLLEEYIELSNKHRRLKDNMNNISDLIKKNIE